MSLEGGGVPHLARTAEGQGSIAKMIFSKVTNYDKSSEKDGHHI